MRILRSIKSVRERRKNRETHYTRRLQRVSVQSTRTNENVIRSHLHDVYTEEVNKIALSAEDDKRFFR